MSKYGNCIECGHYLVPVWFEDIERDKFKYVTGRVRMACSHLLCERCGHTVIVDGSFDHEWHYKECIVNEFNKQ